MAARLVARQMQGCMQTAPSSRAQCKHMHKASEAPGLLHTMFTGRPRGPAHQGHTETKVREAHALLCNPNPETHSRQRTRAASLQASQHSAGEPTEVCALLRR